MKVFVWKYLDHLTSSYHSGGGLVVFADSLERAREIAVKAGEWKGYPEKKPCVQVEAEPDDVREVAGGEEAVYIMPDAGCC